jgi:hypothetical protein
MWFNGTEISNKAQRALRNENVTIVAHNTGYIHCLYKDATIDRDRYGKFVGKLDAYLSQELSLAVFANFLRSCHHYQKFFQVCRDCHGQPQFLKAEVLFHYEHGSDYRVADTSFDKLLAEVSDEDFVPYQIPRRMRCDLLRDFVEKEKPDLRNARGKAAFKEFVESVIPDAEQFVNELADFLHTEAKLPASDKNWLPSDSLEISVEHSREQIISYLQHKRQSSVTADLAFYAYRDMGSCDWTPFIKAAIERNPVSVRMAGEMSLEQVYAWLGEMNDGSIYDQQRLAQPDEVANYRTGDGLEKAFVLANITRQRDRAQDIELIADNNHILLKGPEEYRFTSGKGFEKRFFIPANGKPPIIE